MTEQALSPDLVRKALEWYRDEAAALAKNMQGGAHTQAVLASLTVLALDAGNRAQAALRAQQAPAEPVAVNEKAEWAAFTDWAMHDESLPQAIGLMGGREAGWRGWLARARRTQSEGASLDAKRYAWLRENPTWLGWEHDFRPNEVDAAIDAAIDAQTDSEVV